MNQATDLEAAGIDLDLGPGDTVLLLTDERDDPDHAAATTVAATLARGGARVVVYDRSGETWGDTPHPTGALALTAPPVAERPALRRRMQELDAEGVEVRAWLSTLPSLSEITTAVADLDRVAVIVVPASLDETVTDHLVSSGNVADVVARHLDDDATTEPPPILLVRPGQVSRRRRLSG